MNYQSDLIPTVESLEPRLLLSGFSQAASLELAAPANLTLGSTLLRRRPFENYRFSACANGTLTANMLRVAGRIDPELRLYNANGKLIKRNNNANRRTKNSRIRYDLKAGQTYYVQARSRNKAPGSFRLKLNTKVRDDIGDTTRQAARIRLDGSGSASMTGNIDYAADVDVLKIVATQTGALTLSQTSLVAGLGFRCRLQARTSRGVLLGDNADQLSDGADSELSFDVRNKRTYYVYLLAWEGETGGYNLAMQTDTDDDGGGDDGGGGSGSETVTPGASVVAQVITSGGALTLRIVGTNAADTITLRQNAQGLALTGSITGAYSGAFQSILIYGFDGGDTVRIDNSVTAADTIYLGGGNDTLYDAGMGGATVYAGAGDDHIIAIGGGADFIYGEAGLDSVWIDGSDSMRDISGAEQAAAALHTVAAFYQPYTTTPGAAGYVPLEIAGQNLTDPTLAGSAVGYANFAHLSVFGDGPQYNDADQGSLGDCYFIAALAGLADTDPQAIQQMITPLGDGTYAVRFYKAGQEYYLRVDADLPVRSGGSLAYAGLGSGGETWLPLAEKAYAHFRYGQNSYSSLSGGWMGTVYGHVTGKGSLYYSVGGLGASLHSYIADQLAGGHSVSLGSYSNSTFPIVGSHAYMVKDVSTSGGVQYVTVFNPWGVDGYSYDANPGDGLLKLTVGQIAQHFSGMAVSLA